MASPRFVHVPLCVLAAAILVLAHDTGAAGKPQGGGSGVARFQDAPGDAIRSDGGTPGYVGTFDRDGNFSFATGTQRKVAFHFGPALPLFGGQPPPAGAAIPSNGLKNDVSFAVLTPSSGTSLLAMSPGTSEPRSVRFTWTSKDGGPVSVYGVHFRGNALLDDDGDGVPSEPYPDDGTEMSKMLTSCDAVESGACVQWTLTPCTGQCAGSEANPDPDVSTSPIGQLYGTLSKSIGTRPIARFELAWGLTICRLTATHPCP